MSDIEDMIRRIVREELNKRPPPFPPALPQPVEPSIGRCSVCGIDFGMGPWSYYCSNPKCPTGVTA